MKLPPHTKFSDRPVPLRVPLADMRDAMRRDGWPLRRAIDDVVVVLALFGGWTLLLVGCAILELRVATDSLRYSTPIAHGQPLQVIGAMLMIPMIGTICLVLLVPAFAILTIYVRRLHAQPSMPEALRRALARAPFAPFVCFTVTIAATSIGLVAMTLVGVSAAASAIAGDALNGAIRIAAYAGLALLFSIAASHAVAGALCAPATAVSARPGELAPLSQLTVVSLAWLMVEPVLLPLVLVAACLMSGAGVLTLAVSALSVIYVLARWSNVVPAVDLVMRRRLGMRAYNTGDAFAALRADDDPADDAPVVALVHAPPPPPATTTTCRSTASPRASCCTACSPLRWSSAPPLQSCSWSPADAGERRAAGVCYRAEPRRVESFVPPGRSVTQWTPAPAITTNRARTGVRCRTW
ncbi:MAG: hypothetical protein AB7K09_10410 [Planctomycetota bacterium]